MPLQLFDIKVYVSGMVFQTGIGGVTVDISTPSGTISAVTDSSGVAHLAQVPPGTWKISANRLASTTTMATVANADTTASLKTLTSTEAGSVAIVIVAIIAVAAGVFMLRRRK